MSKPITPDEAGRGHIPDFVFDAFNSEIAKSYSGRQATVKQSDVILSILRRAPEGTERSDVFDNGWLNVEVVYGDVGWCVDYEKPVRGDTFEAHFIFTKRE